MRVCILEGEGVRVCGCEGVRVCILEGEGVRGGSRVCIGG